MSEQLIEELLDMDDDEREEYIRKLSRDLARKQARRKRLDGIYVGHIQEKEFEIKWSTLIWAGVKQAARNAWGWVKDNCLIM